MIKGKFWLTEFSKTDGESNRLVEVLWQNRQAPPPQTEDNVLVSLSADGNELRTIREMFPTWCPRGLNTCYWHGDIARTILGCLIIRRKELLEEVVYDKEFVNNENI